MTTQEKVFHGFWMRLLIEVKHSWRSFTWAFLTISLSLFALTFIFMFLFHFGKMVKNIQENPIAIVFLSVFDQAQAEQLEWQLRNVSPQINTTLLSPEDVLQKAQQNWDPQLAVMLREQNITIPWALIVRSDNGDKKLAELTIKHLKSLDKVQDIILPKAQVKRAQWTLKFLNSMCWLLAFLLSILVVAVVMNTIRIHILKQLVEIKVMRLVGATEAFVRMPYIVEGFLLGFLGAIFAFFLIRIFNFCCTYFADPIFLEDLHWIGVYSTPLWIFVLIILLSAFLGALGSFLILLQDYESEWKDS